MPPINGWKSGVYRIRNTFNNKCYIGSCEKTIEGRWSVHRASLRGGYHHSKHLQLAWNKYGESCFVFEVIERCSPKLCLQKEQVYLDREQAANPKYGYNILPTAGNTRGKEVSEETRAKISAAHKGRKHTAEAKKRMSESLKASEASKVAQKKATDAAAKANTGRKMSKEFCENLSKRLKGKPKTEEHKAKTKSNHWSKRPDAALIAERSASKNRGKKHSDEHKRKITEGNLKRWAKIKSQVVTIEIAPPQPKRIF